MTGTALLFTANGPTVNGTLANVSVPPDALGTAFAATIGWGDGTSSAGTVTGSGSSYTVAGQHTYSGTGPENITVTLTDQYDGSTLATLASPAITSASSTTFVVGVPETFTVQTTGAPTPALSETGALPSGVSFTDNGNGTATLAGTPAAGTAGSYPITITASNGDLPNATQSFTLTVDQVPAITSAASTTSVVGVAKTFTVQSTGIPTPSITETGALPSGMSFTDNGNGTATLAGTPASGSAGTYVLSITASNGVVPAASQSFTLTVLAKSPTPTTSTVTGLITNASSGADLANICVYLYPVGTSTAASYATCSMANGSYELDGVTPGSYDVAFADPADAYVTQWYNGTSGGAATQSGASAVSLSAGVASTGINAAMSQVGQGNVTGTVTASSGGPLANICVYLYPMGTSTAASYATCTLANGTYEITGVASGYYDIAFADPSGSYVTQWYNGTTGGAATQSGAGNYYVPSGNGTLSGINAAMSQVAQGNVTGTVTASGGGALANICVYLYPVGDSSSASAASCSLANGTYEITGVASGSYDVAFADPSGAYATQWYTGSAGGAMSQSGAVAVSVPTGGHTLSAINAAMSQVAQGNITGTVTDAISHTDLANICAYLYPVGNSTAAVAASCSLANGTYEITGVASGSYDVAFADPSGAYVTQWYNSTSTGASAQSGAVAVSVPTGGGTLSAINAAMTQVAQGNITGTVTDAISHTDLANICAYLYPVGNSSAASYATCTLTNGTYEITGVSAGFYDVAFTDPSGAYVSQWYNGTSAGAATQSAASAVSIVGGNQTTSGINAAMSMVQEGNIIGTVTAASGGAPLANICVYVYAVGNSSAASYATCTLTNGTYEITGMTPGSYDVAFYDPTFTYATQWYTGTTGGAPAQSGATAVVVQAGNKTTSGINAAMAT
jgi:HAMP domain-containing protein